MQISCVLFSHIGFNAIGLISSVETKKKKTKKQQQDTSSKLLFNLILFSPLLSTSFQHLYPSWLLKNAVRSN